MPCRLFPAASGETAGFKTEVAYANQWPKKNAVAGIFSPFKLAYANFYTV
jgi:hypothetical protein